MLELWKLNDLPELRLFIVEDNPRGTFSIMATYNDQECGEIGVVVDSSGGLRIGTVEVVPEFQNMGVGKKLLLHCMAFARELGFDSMWAEIGANNFYSQRMFISCGADLGKLIDADKVESSYYRATLSIDIPTKMAEF